MPLTPEGTWASGVVLGCPADRSNGDPHPGVDSLGAPVHRDPAWERWPSAEEAGLGVRLHAHGS